MEILRVHEAEEAIAKALDQWSPDGEGLPEALAYLIACRMPHQPGSYDRIAVPDFIANFADHA